METQLHNYPLAFVKNTQKSGSLSPLHFRSFTDLKVTACADLTESGDTVQVVGGHCLVLLLEEPEGTEGEASMVAVAVLMHGSHLVLRTPV